MKSEARTAAAQLKRKTYLSTVIGLRNRHAICRIIFRLYPILLQHYVFPPTHCVGDKTFKRLTKFITIALFQEHVG